MDVDNAQDQYLNVRETAARLGVHENTVRNWVRDGILPSARVPGTKFHRFNERDVERLVRERGSRVSSVNSEHRQIGPELVDATQLSTWAATRDSHDRFPELVRRLLFSTPGITNISIRAGDGVASPGWDGHAESLGVAALPEGNLYIELGVSHNPKRKANEDWNKRVSDPAGSDPSTSIFVFMTPRRWPRAAEWATARREENKFADVRVLDADDIEGWLQATPAVHHWVSERLGRRPAHAETLERWWERFRNQTAPALPAELFLAGRENERTQLVEFFRQSPEVIAVQARWRDEAIAFICATIEFLEPEETVQPPLLVLSSNVWDQVVQQPGRMTLISLFENPDITAAIERGHHVVLPLGREHSVRGAKLELPRPDRQSASTALEAAGIHDSDRAYRLAGLARRSMASLVRHLARDPRFARPRWSEPPSVEILAPLSLLGAWTMNDDDKAVVGRVAGQEWGVVERTLAHWLNTDDPPFVRSGTQWHLTSPEEAFLVLRESLTSTDLVIWHKATTDVLLELDPRLELADEDRMMAGVRGIGRRFSAAMRQGIAEGVALVGSTEDQPLADSATGAEHARAVVREILTRANTDETGQTWGSLSDVLPLLAEAAPQAFLDLVHEDLDRDTPVLTTMFQDHEQSSWLHTSSPHTGLLWALESLCWSPTFILDASRALAKLDQIDPGGRLGNRPLASLQSVLVGWVKHTSADPPTRTKALKMLCEQLPVTGWKLLFSLWPQNHSSSFPPHAPRFRDWKPESQTVSIEDWVEYIANVVSLAIGLAGNDPERWAELGEHIGPLPSSDKRRVLKFLLEAVDPDSLSDEQRLMLWERLHKEIARHRRFPDANWSLSDETLAELETISHRLEPHASVERHGYLFDWHPDLPRVEITDHAAYDAELLRLRRAAIEETLAAGGVEALEAVAQRSRVGSHLGWEVGGIATEELTPELLPWLDSDDQKLRDVATNWAARKLNDNGTSWLQEVLEHPLLAVSARREALVRAAPATRDVWDLLDGLDFALSTAYWTGMNPWHVPPDISEYAIRKLLAHDRAWAAVDLVAKELHPKSVEVGSLTQDLVKEVLDSAMGSDPDTARSQSLGYEVGLALDYLEGEGIEPEQLARYEFVFFHLLDDHRQPRALFGVMGSHPEFFVDLVKRVYRGKNEVKRQLDEHNQALAHHAWWVLNQWDSLPGAREDGSIDRDHLVGWVQRARLALDESDRTDIGDEEIGRVLSASPRGSDDVWPTEPVREIIEAAGSRSIETGMHVGVINRRGTTSRGPYEGGQQERDLANRYREWAKATAAKYPRTSRLLRGLAENYERDARRMDERAEISADTE